MKHFKMVNGVKVEMTKDEAAKALAVSGADPEVITPPTDPVQKLTAFLSANPDVADLIG